jgi:hypothetical protein
LNTIIENKKTLKVIIEEKTRIYKIKIYLEVDFHLNSEVDKIKHFLINFVILDLIEYQVCYLKRITLSLEFLNVGPINIIVGILKCGDLIF